MSYTHLKVEQEDKDKFKILAHSHKLTMLQLFKHQVNKDYSKLGKTVKQPLPRLKELRNE